MRIPACLLIYNRFLDEKGSAGGWPINNPIISRGAWNWLTAGATLGSRVALALRAQPNAGAGEELRPGELAM